MAMMLEIKALLMRGLILTNNLIISKENQGEISVSRWADLVDEDAQVSPPSLNSKLSPEAPIFVPKNVITKKNESRALTS